LVGGSGDDLMIGGSTAYDTNAAALASILSEWSRTDRDYLGRIADLRNGGGYNGTNLLTASTVTDDGAGDTLTGSAGHDWFWASSSDLVTDLASGELRN